MVNNFPVDQVSLYINWANTSLGIILNKLLTLNLPIKSYPSLSIKVAMFFWFNFSVKLQWLQRRGNKLNTTIFDRYYSQTCKAITFRKITNHTKHK